jgi:hypothetical protein
MRAELAFSIASDLSRTVRHTRRMRAVTRRVLDSLDARASAKTAAEGWAFHVPTVCEHWLDDTQRVKWLHDRLVASGQSSVSASRHDQIGQVFCNVIEAWGDDLVEQRAPRPQAIMTDIDFASWQVAMLKYPWDLQS